MVWNGFRSPFSVFAPPGSIRISDEAWNLAREFDERVRRSRSYKEWVISFDWGDSRSIRRRIDGPMEDVGPGLDIVAYDRTDVPNEAVQRKDGIMFAIKIPSRIYQLSVHRLIDVDETAFSKVVLR
jgi:hypothetical protein